MYLYQKGDYESMRKDAFGFAKENISKDIQIIAQYKRALTDYFFYSRFSG